MTWDLAFAAEFGDLERISVQAGAHILPPNKLKYVLLSLDVFDIRHRGNTSKEVFPVM